MFRVSVRVNFREKIRLSISDRFRVTARVSVS